MNIKIVYNTKTHKISSKYQTLEDIKNAIQILYPQQLQNGFDIYVTLHSQMDPIKIIDETSIIRIKELYNQMNWSSIKFLIKDSINPNLTNYDLSILNQSVIVQPNIQLSTIMNLFQQPQQQNQEEHLNQKQQIVIQHNNKIKPNLTQEIINQIDKQEFQGLDYNTEEFKQFIIERIDKRLKYHGILSNQIINQQLPLYKMELNQQDFMITKNVNEKFEWQLQITNTGDIIWKQNQVSLIGLNGYFQNIKIELEHDINPGQTAKFKYLLQMPNYEIQNQKNEFQMIYNEQNQLKYFGKIISLIITVKQNLEKIKQLMDSAEISFEKAMEFIEMYGSENQIDEIILAYFEQPK